MNSSQNLYRPRYGAFELKAKYRRNMLLGTLFSAMLALTTTAGAFLFTQTESVSIENRKGLDPGSGRVHWEPEYSVERAGPRSGSNYRSQLNADGSVIVMVNDDVLIDDDLRVWSKTDEYAFGFHDDTEGIEGGTDNPGYGYGGDGDNYYPDPDSFVICEVMPEMLYEHQPDYPRLAQTARLEAVVWIKALIDLDGSVRDAMIFVSSGSKAGFDEAALQAAYKCKYNPAIQNGRPVPVWVSYRVEFVLEGCAGKAF